MTMLNHSGCQFGEQEYSLTLERWQPGSDRERPLTVRGKIRNLRTGRESRFRLWLEDDSSIVPVRFEWGAGYGLGEAGPQSQRILQD
jgi:hypothetical protein